MKENVLGLTVVMADGRVVRTNTVSNTAFRGFGGPQGALLMEDVLPAIARATGGGIAEHFGLGIDEVPVLVGTLGKAFGTAGAFVAGSEELIETLIQFARPYIYTTALPPAQAAATRAAISRSLM